MWRRGYAAALLKNCEPLAEVKFTVILLKLHVVNGYAYSKSKFSFVMAVRKRTFSWERVG